MVRFNRIAPQDPVKGFAQLSKTIRAVGQHLKQNDEMEVEERKAHAAYQNDLDSIFGVVGKTAGFEHRQYKELVQKQNAIAQKEGIIKAYENFSYLDSVSEERATIRLNAYQNEMKKYIPAMANATTPLDYDSADSAVYDILNTNEGVVGVDSTGNDVTMDFELMNTAEIVAMSRGLTKNRMVVDSAVDDLRHEEAIKSSEQRYQTELLKTMDLWAVEETRGLLSTEFKDLADEYFGYGVQGINALTLNTIEAKAVEIMSDPNADSQSLVEVYGILDMFENDVVMRDGAGVFAAPGTDNFIQVEQIRKQARNTYFANQRARGTNISKLQDDAEARILADLVNQALSYDDLTPSNIRALKRNAAEQAIAAGLTDIDGLTGKIDSFISSQEIDDSTTKVSFLHRATGSKYDRETLQLIERDAYLSVRDGRLTASAYGVISTQIEGYMNDLADPTVIKYADAKDRVSKGATAYEDRMKDVLMKNDVPTSKFDRQTGVTTLKTQFGQDNKPRQKYIHAIREYDDSLDNIAIYGGEVKNVKFSVSAEYKDGEPVDANYKFLLESGLTRFEIDDIIESYNTELKFEGPALEGSNEEIRRAREIDNKVAKFAEAQGLMQLLEYREYFEDLYGNLDSTYK